MLLRITFLFTYSFGLASTGGGSLDGDVGSGIFIGCPFIFSGKWLGLVWFVAPSPSSEDDSLPFSSSGSLKWTRSPALELDLGSLWFTRTPSSLGLGAWCAPWLEGVCGGGWCSVATKSMELVVWRAAALLLSSGAGKGKVKPLEYVNARNHSEMKSQKLQFKTLTLISFQLLHWLVWPCLFKNKFPWKRNIVKVEGKGTLFQFGKINQWSSAMSPVNYSTTSLKYKCCFCSREFSHFFVMKNIARTWAALESAVHSINHSLLCCIYQEQKTLTLTFDSQTSCTGHCAIFIACSTGETAGIFWKYFSNNESTNLLCKASEQG